MCCAFRKKKKKVNALAAIATILKGRNPIVERINFSINSLLLFFSR